MSVRGLLKKAAITAIFCAMAIASMHGETPSECSWRGPEPDRLLARALPRVQVVGSLGSDIVGLLHESGIPISFISQSNSTNANEGPEVRIERQGATSVRELLEMAMNQNPAYRFSAVSGKLVIYPRDERYDELVEIGEVHEATRASALSSVLSGLRSKRPELRGLELPTLRGPFLGLYGDKISIGGARAVVEHLTSLIADRPSAAFVIFMGEGGSRAPSICSLDAPQE